MGYRAEKSLLTDNEQENEQDSGSGNLECVLKRACVTNFPQSLHFHET